MANLDTSTILTYRFAQTVFNRTLVANRGHVDKVDNNQTTQVTQAELAGDFISGFKVGVEGGLFDITPRVARAELMSMAVSASVVSITIEPPDGRRTSRWKADSICDSI